MTGGGRWVLGLIQREDDFWEIAPPTVGGIPPRRAKKGVP